MNKQEERLRQEIIADAKKKAERIQARAETEKDRLLKKFRQEMAELREERLQEIHLESNKQIRSLQNTFNMEKRKRWLLKREDEIQALFAEVLNDTENFAGEKRQQSLVNLAKEALLALPPAAYKVEYSSVDSSLVTLSWLESLLAELGNNSADSSYSFELQENSSMKGGIRFCSADLSKVFDNSYENRLTVLQEPLRQLLAE
jgi:vacuolar-type H+-ATPase subunit E/Vma4